MSALCAWSAVLTWNLLRDGVPLSLDSSSQYWPWYVYLGQSLRGGRIPAWNPSAFGGTPFAADPLSGWTYLPAMSLFAVLPPGAAIFGFVFGHFLLASLAAAALARALGLVWPAAVVSGAVYAGSGFFQFQSVAVQPYAAVAAWLPVCLLGAARALQTTRSEARWGWWCTSGLALSQVIAAWPGQGAYYVMLIFGSWTAARGLAVHPDRPRNRFWRAAAHLGVPMLLGVSLAAAGILPRLELQPLSNLAGGYALADQVGGWRLTDYARLVTPGPWYVGIVSLGLTAGGLAALVRGPVRLSPGRAPLVTLAAQWLATVVLAASVHTPLHALAAILPGFAGMQSHIPERVLVVGYLAPALLAGLGFAAARAWLARNWAATLLGAAACLDLVLAGRFGVDSQVGAPWDSMRRVADYDTSLTPSAAANFLLGQPGAFRYLGYDGDSRPYTDRFADPRTIALLVNNRALSLGLHDVQGYDAIHLARFDAYLTTVNGGRTQNYHDGQVFDTGIQSPLLDLLNVRFIVLPPDSPEIGYRVVFQDALARVAERPSALPRGWLVHEARAASRDEALQLIGSGSADPRRTALIEPGGAVSLANLSPLAGGNDQVTLVWDRPEAAQWKVASDSPGILVMGEVTYPAWVAYLDGQRTSLLTADGLLRAVAVPAGQHTVDMRYESATLSAGLAISTLSLLGVGALIARALRAPTPARARIRRRGR